MIRYLAIGAVAGFLVAYFLLSHELDGPAPQPPPAPAVEPSFQRGERILKLAPLRDQTGARRSPQLPPPSNP